MIIDRCEPARHLRIAVPCYTGEIRADTARSLLLGTAALSRAGIAWSFDFEPGCCYLDHTRNILATRFYIDPLPSDLLLVDADVVFLPDAMVELAKSDRPFVAGIYPKKSDDPQWPVAFEQDELRSDEVGYLEASMVPTGFLRINRSVFDAVEPQNYETDDGQKWLGWFHSGVRDGRYVGEDAGFCIKWRQLGGKLYIVPDMTLAHVGTRVYQGNFAKWMREQT